MKPRRSPGRRSACGWALGALLALTLACGAEPPQPPDVVLVSVDTLRADRVWPVARSREIAPFLASIAESGVSFRRAYSTTSWTAPAVASLLSGTYPSRHGVEHGAFWRGGILGQEMLPEGLPLLPELLRERGYRTFGITANGHLAEEFGFARGFDRYRCVGFSDAHALVAVLSGWLPEIRSARPYFLWLHLLDPHAPYTRREPYFGERRSGAAAGPGLEALEGVARAGEYARRGVRPGSEELAYVEALYDAEVSHVDAVLRQVFERLAPDPGALLVVTSDHGEEFLEHGGFGHGEHLFEEVVRVPLLIRYPDSRYAGVRVHRPVSLVDVLPTILEEVGTPPPPGVQGAALRPGMADAPPPVHLELARQGAWTARVEGDWKLIAQHEPTESLTLYDLAADPEERRDRAVSEAERIAALQSALGRHRDRSRAGRSGEPRLHHLDAARLEALRALGYAE